MGSEGTFSGRCAAVTGASGNLGSAVARAFLEAGARLALIDRRQAAVADILPGEVKLPKAAHFGGVDLTVLEEVNDLAEKISKEFGPIDFLVNIAGGYRAGPPVHETDESSWQFLLDLNARTVFNTAVAFTPGMRARGFGKIVNIASRSGLRASAGAGPYSVSKSAVLRLTEAMSAENKDQGINVNCVIPGTIDTPQNRKAMPAADSERWVQPDSLAQVILFLCSAQARDIHGAAIPVYGLS